MVRGLCVGPPGRTEHALKSPAPELLGTDSPYETGDTYVRAVDYMKDPQIDPRKAQAILDGSAGALLGIRES
jgi:hypothetical protein